MDKVKECIEYLKTTLKFFVYVSVCSFRLRNGWADLTGLLLALMLGKEK